jgi:hypothetical protein
MRKLCAPAQPAILGLVALGCLAGWAGPSTVHGQDKVVERDGVRYLESTDTVEQPTTHLTFEEHKETIYREQYRTDVVETQRTVLVPVTEYQWEPRVHHWWNPLVPNTIAYHMVPRTRWEARNHTIRYPQNYRELVPEERIVRVPKRHLGFEQQQRTTLTALGPASGAGQRQLAAESAPAAQAAATVARQPAYIGGVQKLEGDLPRYSTRPGGVRGYR